MRLHTLGLTAFGPFPGHEHVDFDALDHGILLVTGPTGSGKSSLLDAVTFALFGDVAGVRRTLKQSLRSHHAPPEREPSVELVFSVGTTRWRIRRVPQWEAPKRRGSGTTTRHASVQLSQWRDGEWHLVSSRIDESAEMMRDVLGMGLDQFAQVVLLPQGEFAEFLRARPEDRRVLLERLFDVERFESVERWFVEARGERSAASQRSLVRIEGHLTVVTDTLARLADPEIGQLEWTSDDVADLPERLRILLTRVRQRRDIVVALAQEDARRAGAAERALDRSADLLEARRSYHRALADLESWPQEAVDEMHETIEAAAGVAGVLKLARRRDVARAEADETLRTLQGVAVDLEGLTGREELSDAPVEESFPAQTLTERGTHLHDLHGRVRQLRATLTSVETARRAWETAREENQAAEASLDETRGRLARSAEQVTAHAERLEALPDVTSQLGAVSDLLRRLERAPALRRAVEDAELARTAALEQHVTAEREVVRLRTARLDGMAAELAGALQAGHPCPVCGSCEHPAPTPPTGESPTTEQIQQAEDEARRADARRVNAENELAGARATLESFVAQVQTSLDEELPAESLRADALLDDASPLASVRDRLTASAEARSDAASALETARTTHREAENAMASAQALRERRAARFESAQSTLDEGLERLRREIDDVLALTSVTDLDDAPSWPCAPHEIDLGMLPGLGPIVEALQESVSTAQQHHRRVEAGVQALAHAQLSARTATAHAEAAETELCDELVTKGHDDVESARAVAMPEDELDDLRARWQHALETRAAALSVVRTETVAAAARTPPPNEDRLRQRAEILTRRSERSRAEASSWERAHDVLSSMRDTIADAVREHLPLAAAAQEMQDLSSTFTGTGENTHRMRLTSYVLAAHLETVTSMANERLHRMTDGRYQLQYTDERARGTARSGLGLRVVDAWTGQARDTSTLSGGEAFMASLALALGLGDAVRADSGGMELHTLFVDEGFGSLDQDTLEQVMDVLDNLREGGRLVGIVSHVSELQDRIPTRIEVRKTSEGSSVRTTDSSPLTVSPPR